MSYRPLPDNVTIKESSIDGLGLFATKDIPKFSVIGYTHVYVEDNVTGTDWLRLPLGGFYNHSDEPNCVSLGEDKKFKALYALKDIKAGEELTCSYSLYNVEM